MPSSRSACFAPQVDMTSACDELTVRSSARPSAPPAQRVRSTLLLASIDSLRTAGLLERYLRRIDFASREAILTSVAGTWLPMETAYAHYGACEGLDLPIATQIALGRDVGTRMQGTVLGILVRLARHIGATPWTALEQVDRFVERLFDGGRVRTTRRGPKEARLEIEGLPLLAIPYFRHAFRGAFLAGFELFWHRGYVQELAARSASSAALFRVAWV